MYITSKTRSRYALADRHDKWSLSDDVLQDVFESTLKDYETMFFTVSGFSLKTASMERYKIKCVTRWHKEYQRKVLAKFYKLDQWYVNAGRPPVTMCTLTTVQRNLDRRKQIQLLDDSRKKFIDAFRKQHKGVQYFYVWEPHKSGYAHIHILFFCTVSRKEAKHWQTYWNEKLGAGGFSAALKFDRARRNMSLNSAKNYVMKYVSKTYSDGALKNPFYAIVNWYSRRDVNDKGIRLYGVSQLLSRQISLQKAKTFIYEWFEFSIGGNVVKRYVSPDFSECIRSYLSVDFDRLDRLPESEKVVI